MKEIFMWAKMYVRKGLSVIPMLQDENIPAIDWHEYRERKPTVKELEQWLNKDYNYNIGIVTGIVSRIVVVDIHDINANRDRFISKPRNTPTVDSHRGVHMYFRPNNPREYVELRTDIPGISVWGEGEVVLAPPSIHPSGHQYFWINDRFSFSDDWMPKLPSEYVRNEGQHVG